MASGAGASRLRYGIRFIQVPRDRVHQRPQRCPDAAGLALDGRLRLAMTSRAVWPGFVAFSAIAVNRGRAALARSGEIRFEPESGLSELRAEWHNLTKRVIPL